MSKRKTPEEYYNECKSKGYDLPIEDYVNNKIKIKHKCKQGHIYEQRPADNLRGVGCPKCSGTYSYTPEEYYQECKSKGLDLPIEDYINTSTKIKHKCRKGHIYLQRPSDHLRGHRCKKCADDDMKYTRRKTSEKYYNECKSKGLDLPIDSYVVKNTKIKHRCKQGHIYYQRPHRHLQGDGCPICNESHGEKYIRNYLDKNHIKYIPQKKFHDLKDKTYLSYDFYLPDYNILIEYQGEQHYKSNGYFGGESQFKKQQYHDNLKREYAKNNGYKLIELKYTLDTQELVDRYLSRRIK